MILSEQDADAIKQDADDIKQDADDIKEEDVAQGPTDDAILSVPDSDLSVADEVLNDSSAAEDSLDSSSETIDFQDQLRATSPDPAESDVTENNLSKVDEIPDDMSETEENEEITGASQKAIAEAKKAVEDAQAVVDEKQILYDEAEFNEIRKAEGLPELKVSLIITAYAQANLNYSLVMGEHSPIALNENLITFTTSDPYQAWYENEKANVEKGSGQVGHYYNIIKPYTETKTFTFNTGTVLKSDYAGMTGYATTIYTNSQGKELHCGHVQEFTSMPAYLYVQSLLTVDEYRDLFHSYLDTIKLDEKKVELDEAQEALDKAQADLNVLIKPTNTPTPKPTATNTPTPKPTATNTPTPVRIDISGASVKGVSLSYGYTGKARTPSFKVIINDAVLTEGTDYTYDFNNNIEPGTAEIIIKGKGNYTGTRIKTFEIVDCVSSLVSGKTYQLIPKNNSTTAVCSYSGRMVNNTKVYITDRSKSEAMRFVARKNADGTWKFINAKCEMSLAVKQNSSEEGAGIVLYDQTGKKAQNWKLSKKSDNSFAIINAVSGLSIAMSDSSAVKGTTLSLAETASSGLQRFYIAETDAVDASYDGTYAVKALKNQSFALNVASSSRTDGANIQLYSYSGTNAQKFTAIHSGSGYYRLVNKNSGLVLTVKGNTKANGANVIQSAWKGQSGQRWKIIENDDGTVTLQNVLGTYLHLTNNLTKDGTNICARNAAETKAQRWYLHNK